MTPNAKLPGPIKSVRIPKSDVDAAKSVEPPRFAKTESSRRFAAMGAAILEKLCRSGGLSVRARKTLPYVLDTARGRVAISVMVSTVSGDPTTKHMVVPLTSLPAPPGVGHHVLVCAFASKHERTREANGGLNVRLVGWATSKEALRYARVATRVATQIAVAAVPVSVLHPIQSLRHYLAPPAHNKQTKEGDKICEENASGAS